MAHLVTEAEPPLDGVLFEPGVEVALELVAESELDPPAGLLTLLVVEPVVVSVSVVAGVPVLEITGWTHGLMKVVVEVEEDVGAEVVVGAGEVDAVLVGVAALLVAEASVAVPDAGAVTVEQVEALLVLVTLPAAELSSLPGALTADAPVEGLIPAPPAVSLWWCLGLTGRAAGASAVARAGAVETVAATARAMAWSPVG